MERVMNVVIGLLLCAIVPASSVIAAVPPKKVVIGISKIVAHPALDAVEKGIQDQLERQKLALLLICKTPMAISAQ